MLKLNKNNKGDTMIEVMMCLIIASLVFSAAYAAARKSTNSITSARERIAALKIAETQAELLRAVPPADQATGFCLDTAGAPKSLPSGTPNPTTPASDGAYVASCKSTIYRIGIIQTPSTKNYQIFVRWDALGGGINQVQLNYALQ